VHKKGKVRQHKDWEEYGVLENPTSSNVTFFAHQLGVHPVIVAGRIRKELGNYRLLNNFVGTGDVRRMFNP
jgi:HTH-type transcriptional regulator / antitoxin HigA